MGKGLKRGLGRFLARTLRSNFVGWFRHTPGESGGDSVGESGTGFGEDAEGGSGKRQEAGVGRVW